VEKGQRQPAAEDVNSKYGWKHNKLLPHRIKSILQHTVRISWLTAQRLRTEKCRGATRSPLAPAQLHSGKPAFP